MPYVFAACALWEIGFVVECSTSIIGVLAYLHLMQTVRAMAIARFAVASEQFRHHSRTRLLMSLPLSCWHFCHLVWSVHAALCWQALPRSCKEDSDDEASAVPHRVIVPDPLQQRDLASSIFITSACSSGGQCVNDWRIGWIGHSCHECLLLVARSLLLAPHIGLGLSAARE